MRSLLVGCALLCGVASVATAAPTLKGGYVACVTAAAYEQAVQATVQKDQRAFDFLLEKTLCIITKSGLPISVLKTTWTGTAHVRVYLENNQTIEVWTPRENIVE